MAEATPSVILQFLTGPRGAFSLVPTAKVWLLKDVSLMFVSGSVLLLDQDLTLDLSDLVFRSLACLLSAALLASLLERKPRVFECCYWAHMSCVPVDLALALAFIFLKEDLHVFAPPHRHPNARVRGLDELNATALNSTDAPGGTNTSITDERAVAILQPNATDATLSPLLAATLQMVRLRRDGAGLQLLQQQPSGSELQSPLNVFLAADHAVSVVARSHLVWRMYSCLCALVYQQTLVSAAATAAGAAGAAATLASAEGLAPDSANASPGSGTLARPPLSPAPGDGPAEEAAGSSGDEKQRSGSGCYAGRRASDLQQEDLLFVLHTTSSSSSILVEPRSKR
ncbi:hypothetical protein V5799_003257 [Amblyomma americanum]|uniref:Uncharacterized protein n=1 Tax=Amblyomma americanum TaxID=6943 RepID=A0AAQ4D9G9_AMBAM